MSETKRPSIQKKGRNTAFDQELIDAKRAGTSVRIFMPFEMDFTDTSAAFRAVVKNVDVYALKVESGGREFWINKSFVVAVVPSNEKFGGNHE